ncbi:MAG: metallophosphoesterase family protein, partial [bacterium]
MKIAVLSDIHSNYDAYKKAFELIKDEKPEHIVMLGDIVGYGAEPHLCLKAVKNLTQNIVAGNHDYGVAGLTSIDYFNTPARIAIEWTRKQLNKDDIYFLRSLPLSFRFDDFLFVHSSPDEPSSWTYIFDEFEARVQFRFFKERILFVGHTHIPIIWVENGDPIWLMPNIYIELNREKRYIINVGSIGQPRDGDPRGAFGVFDTDKWGFKIVRFEYDIVEAHD